MAVDDDYCFDFTELHDLNSGDLVLPGFHEFSESQLYVPPDSLEGLELEWFPCFSDDFITSKESSFCFASDQPRKHEPEEKTKQRTDGTVSDDWVGISEDAISGFTKKKSRSKKTARRSLTVIVRKRCSHCETAETPQWRQGPEGPKTLCNACGMRFRSGRLLPEYRPAASPTFVEGRHSNYHRKIMEKRGLDC